MRKTRKFIAFMLAFVMLMPIQPIAANPNNSDTIEANALIDYLIHADAMSETVTRAEFTAALAEVLKLDGQQSPQDKLFEDVLPTSEYANQIYAALQRGLISENDKFYPNDTITVAQALKMTVTALDYDIFAKYSGGYPYGYMKAAKRLDIADGTADPNAKLLKSDACDILYRMLMCTQRITGITNGDFRYEDTDVTNLELLHGLKICRGIVTETNFNSYRTNHSVTEQGYISIDGVQYYYDGADTEMLGRYACVYYYSGTHNAVLAAVLDNDEELFDIDDVSDMTATTLSVTNEKNKIIDYDIRGAMVIFNGRVCSTFNLNLYNGDYGTVRLTDNDRDGKYEYVFIESYQYMYVNHVDSENEIITDESGTRMYKTADDGITAVYDKNGARLGFEDIRVSSVAAVAASSDGKLGKIVLCDATADALINSISDDEIEADGIVYKVSDYAWSKYTKEIEVGKTVTLYLGLGNDVAAVLSGIKDMKYGYLIDADAEGGLEEKIRIKIFTEDGVTKIFGAESVKFNSEEKPRKDRDILIPISNGTEIEPQPIRYKTESGGDNIIRIDTAETMFDFDIKPTNDNDSLRRHSFSSGGTAVTQFLYKSGGKSCAPYFNLEGTLIFSVPKDNAVKNADESEFSVATADVLTNNKNYPFEVYDLNENGSAGIAVVKGTYIDGTQDYMVEKVLRGVMPDENDGTVARCVRNGKYRDVYIPNSLGVKVSAGDIITVHDNALGIADKVYIIFYGSGTVPVPNVASGAYFEDASHNSFWYGMLYSKGSVYGYVSDVKDADGNYDFSFENLKNLKMNTTNISVINKNRTEIRPITLNELKDYKYFGNDSHYVVIKLSDSQSPSSIYVYER